MAGRLLLLVTTFVLLGSAAAWSATIRGTNHADRLRGTPGADSIFGQGGNDRIDGLGGNDLLDGGGGRDTISAGTGDDRVAVSYDGARDSVRCGRGRDLVNADLQDRIGSDCEVLARRLSADPFSNSDSQHETQVEPASAAFGRKVVAAFQSGRFFDGGASGIGFATTSNGGQTWHAGFLPGLTALSPSPGSSTRVSDPTAAYDALHGVWLVASLALAPDRWQMLVSRSTDGVSWNLPVSAVASAPETLDKGWLACDNWPSSPFRGRCYLSYLDIASNEIATRFSADGGLTWSAPASSGPSSADVNGAQPLVRPDGTLVVVYSSFARRTFEESDVLAVRSADGGVTFSPPSQVALLQTRDVRGFRSAALPSAGIDGSGRLYAVWQDCRFSAGCAREDLVLATSTDGVTWSNPTRIPTTTAAGTHSLVPGLGVDPSTSGATARLALVYYTLTADGILDAAMISSASGGARWGRPVRLDAESMQLDWLASTDAGAMLGDYLALSFVGGRAIPIFSLALAPVAGRHREAIYARVR